jgi:hypothetical protein
MAITITEILGTDSISGSRLTINSNFLLLENAYNDLEDSFNINVLTGSLDVSAASSGQIKAKSFIGNSLVMPSSGTPTVQIYGTGASAGNITAAGTVAGGTGAFSTFLSTNGMSASGPATFGATATFSSVAVNDGQFVNGVSGTYIERNYLKDINYLVCLFLVPFIICRFIYDINWIYTIGITSMFVACYIASKLGESLINEWFETDTPFHGRKTKP